MSRTLASNSRLLSGLRPPSTQSRACFVRNVTRSVRYRNSELKRSRQLSISQQPRSRFQLASTRFTSTAAALKPQLSATSDRPQASTSDPQAKKDGDLPLTRWDEKKVYVGWEPSTWSKFHNFWLRDHCRCPECFHQITKQRLVNTFEISPEIQPSGVEASPEGLKVTWHSSESHTSIYPWDWLKWHSYDPVLPNRDDLLPFRAREKVLWGAKIVQDPPTVEHDYIMNDERGLWKLLKRIDTFGFCFIPGVDATPEATENLTTKIGNIRKTQYGEFWDFTSDLAKGDTAYTTLALGAHTDTTYFTDPCGLQLFHLLSHTDGHGGATLLVDGFYVASILKELHPDAYNALTKVRVLAHAAGEPDSFFRPSPASGYPLLSLDPRSGELVQVRYNNDDRSTMNSLSPEELEQWYDALRLWNKALKSPDSEFWVQLTPGTAVVIDNHRVLHGRSVFNGKRRMCGAYIGMDDFRSKLTVLSEKFSAAPAAAATEERTKTRSVWSPLL